MSEEYGNIGILCTKVVLLWSYRVLCSFVVCSCFRAWSYSVRDCAKYTHIRTVHYAQQSQSSIVLLQSRTRVPST